MKQIVNFNQYKPFKEFLFLGESKMETLHTPKKHDQKNPDNAVHL